MKNMVKLFGIIAVVAVIGFTLAGCGNLTKDMEYFDATTAGQLTITGLSDLSDGDVIEAFFSSDDASLYLYAGERAQNEYNPNESTNISISFETFPGTVANGQAVLKVFVDKGLQSGKGGGWQSYTGNDQNVKFNVGGVPIGTVTVTFTNGIASGVFVANN